MNQGIMALLEENKLPDGYVIRVASVEDTDRFYNLRKQLAAESDFLGSPSKESIREDLEKDSPWTSLIVLYNGEAVGQCMTVNSEPRRYLLASIGVLKKHSGKGIASSLIAKTKEIAISNNATVLELYVELENKKALSLYKSSGFKERKRITTLHMAVDID